MPFCLANQPLKVCIRASLNLWRGLALDPSQVVGVLLASPCTLKGSGYEGVGVFGCVGLRQVSPTRSFCTVGSPQPVQWSASCCALPVADLRLVEVQAERENFLMVVFN